MTSDNQVKPLPARPDGKRRRFGAYVAAWAALALLAAFYLAALALRPDLVTEQLPIFRSGEPEGNQGQRAMSKALAEVQGLRQSVSQMQLELAKLKTDVSAAQDQDKSITSRITQLEDRIATAQPALADASAKVAASEAKLVAATPPAKAAADTSRIETGSIAAKVAPLMAASVTAPATAVQPKLINATAPAQPTPVVVAQAAQVAQAATAAAAATAKAEPVVTSDAEAATLTSFGPATVTPAKAEPVDGAIGLKISNGRSLDALRLSWSLLSDRHPSQLGRMQARYAARVPEGDGEPTFDLIAGPVKTAAEAKRVCKALAAKNIPCQIGSFSGPSL